MKRYESYLPSKKPVKIPNGIMVRPRKEILKWLAELAAKHGTSVNMIVVALLEAEFFRPRDEK